MLGILDWIKIGGGALAGAVIAAAIAYPIGHAAGDRQGYNRRIAEQAVADTKAEAERKGDDAKIGNMADYDLCVASLKRRGMPVEPCDELRGIQPE
jgi:hypothetical protein